MNLERCRTCNGQGWLFEKVRRWFFWQLVATTPCPDCNGLGKGASDASY